MHTEPPIDTLCRDAYKAGLALLFDGSKLVKVNLDHLTPAADPAPFTDADRIFLVWTNERKTNRHGSERRR